MKLHKHKNLRHHYSSNNNTLLWSIFHFEDAVISTVHTFSGSSNRRNAGEPPFEVFGQAQNEICDHCCNSKMILALTPGHTHRNCVIGGVTSPEAEATDYLSIIFLEVNSFWSTLQSLTLALPGNLPSLGFICHRYAHIHRVVVICNTWGKCRWGASDPKLHMYQRPSPGHSNTLLSL